MKQLFTLLLLCCSTLLYAQPLGGGGALAHGATYINPSTLGTTFNPQGSGAPGTITPTTTPVTTAQWHFAGQKNATRSEDWIYSLVTTNKKETIACGYSAFPGIVSYATIFKLDHLGNLVWSKDVDYTVTPVTLYDYSAGSAPGTEDSMHNNDLWSVTKASDGYVAVGRGNGILIVEVDENGNFINGTPIDVIPDGYPSAHDGSFSSLSGSDGSGYSVAVDPNTNSVKNIIVGGTVYGAGFLGAGLWQMNYNVSTAQWVMGNTYYGGNATNSGGSGSNITKILTQSTGSGYEIYACGAISSTYDNIPTTTATNASPFSSISYMTFDKDIWILKMDNNFSSIASAQYDKSNIKVGGAAINSSGAYTNTSIYPYEDFGPFSARNYDLSGNVGWWDYTTSSYQYNSNASSYLNALNNKNEGAYDMTFTADGKIAVICLVNLIGNNPKGGMSYTGNVYTGTGSGVVLNGSTSASPTYGEYVDGDAFLLKITPGDIGVSTTSTKAKNAGHFSGSDFFMQVKQDPENNYIIAGSTADRYNSTDYNFPNPEESEQNAFIVAATDTWTTGPTDLWRRSFIAADARATDAGPDPGENNVEGCICAFAMDLTADGGYVIGGNNDNNSDDQSITKFAPPHQEMMEDGVTSGGYTAFGGGAIPTIHDITGTETWNTSMNVASLVTVENGATLYITGATTFIGFAASDQLWDYFTTPSSGYGPYIGCGIVVKPGGTLNITSATLQGISITGQHNVWDGIVVEGTSTSSSYALQGKATLSGATITDARYGLYVAENYRTYYRSAPVPAAASGGLCNGYNYGSRYNGYTTLGGGIITAQNYSPTVPTTFLNCYYGANFENYAHPNNSTFTGCTFNSDATCMGDICFYTDATGGLLPVNTHIAAWSWNGGINLYNNTFTCYNPWPPLTVRPTGIQAILSRLMVTNGGSGAGNTFTNLGYGIMVNGGDLTDINYNTFDNNLYAINAGSNSLVIQNNNIDIPNIPPYYAGTGITLAGSHGYIVSKNTFDKCSTCGPYGDVGIVVNDGVVTNEVINNNIFNRMSMATISLQNNGDGGTGGTTGLQYHCNNFQYSYMDISRYATMYGYTMTIPATLNNYQGSCAGGATGPAGNQFNVACGGAISTQRLWDGTAVTQAIIYNNNYSSTGSFTSIYDPSPCYSALYSDNGCFPSFTSVPTACPTPLDYMPPAPCPACAVSPGPIITILGTLDGEMPSARGVDTIAALQAAHDAAVNSLVMYYAMNGSYDSAAALLASYNLYRDAFGYYMADADYRNAATMYSSLPLVTGDDSLYAWEAGLMLALYSSSHTWFDLDAASADSMLRIVQYNTPAGYMAGSITALLGLAPVTWPVPVLDTAMLDSVTTAESEEARHATTNSSGSTPPITNVNNTGIQSFSVFPNPTYGSITINTSGSGIFELYTIEGQLISRYKLAAGSADMVLPATLASGIYMGVFKPDAGGVQNTVRLVYQP